MQSNLSHISGYPALLHHTSFGSLIENRSWSAGNGYRFGFQGQEDDAEVSGDGNSYTAEYWQYDSRLARRWNVDPKNKKYESPYVAFSNCPLVFVDPLGDTTIFYSNSGKELGQINDKLPATFISVDDEFASTIKDEITKLNNSDLSDESLDNAANYLRMQGTQYSLQDFTSFFDEHQEVHDNSDWAPYDSKGPLLNEYAIGYEVDERGRVKRATEPIQGNPEVVVPLPNSTIRLHTHPNPERWMRNIHTGDIGQLEGTNFRSLGTDRKRTKQTTGTGLYDIVVDPINIYLFNNEVIIAINRKSLLNKSNLNGQ